MSKNETSVSQMAAKGGQARAKSLTAQQRKDIAKAAVSARWEKNLVHATHVGELHIADRTIACAVLEDGRRVLTQESFLAAIGRAAKAKAGTGSTDLVDGLPPFLVANNLKPFITNELRWSTAPIVFRSPASGGKAFGFDATLLPKVCEVYLSARDAGKLNANQKHVAVACEILMRGLATVGIIALVDEATGYQDSRARDALAQILEAFVAKEIQKWMKTFPPDFYKELCRLRNIPFNGTARRPQYIGHLTNDVVYARLAPGILKDLRSKNPAADNGHRKSAHHQWLTPDLGHPKLLQHLSAVTALMKVSDSWDGFKQMLDRALPPYKEMPLFDGLED